MQSNNRIIVQAGGEPDPVQVCRCHTNRSAKKGQILYKIGNWAVPKDTHLTGCPILKDIQVGAFGIICSG